MAIVRIGKELIDFRLLIVGFPATARKEVVDRILRRHNLKSNILCEVSGYHQVMGHRKMHYVDVGCHSHHTFEEYSRIKQQLLINECVEIKEEDLAPKEEY